MGLDKKFIIITVTQEDWDKVLLILSVYGFSLHPSTTFTGLLNDHHYLRYNGNARKRLIGGSLRDGFLEARGDHKELYVSYLIENY